MSPKIDVKALTKALTDAKISTKLSEPDNFVSSGNLSMNYICTGNFRYALPNRRTLMLAGPQGTGKTYIASNIAKLAQDLGYFIAYVDTEHSLEKRYLDKVGVNQDSSGFLPMNVASIEGVALAASTVFRNTEPQDKVMMIVDSLGNLDTEDSLAQFEKEGTLKNDMGIKAKKIKQLLRDVNVHAGNRDMFVVYTNHVYANQDPMNGKGKYIVNGGEASLYIPSITLMLDKKPLRDEDAKTAKEKAKVFGLEMSVVAYKTRFTKWMGKTHIEVPYDAGMDPLSGFKEFAKDEGLLVQNGAWLSFQDLEGKEHKFYERDLDQHIEAILKRYDKQLVENEEEVVE